MAESKADEVAKVEARGEKQLETLYKAVEPLTQLGFFKFIACIKRQAYAYNWAGHLYDVGVPELSASLLSAITTKRSDNAARAKAYADMKNLYMLLLKKCEGHTVHSRLSSAKMGDARACINKLYGYFYPKTPSGQQTCYTAFNTNTQSNTNTTLVEWMDVVATNADILSYVSGIATEDSAKMAVLLNGVLPEFEPVKLIINYDPSLDYDQVCDNLLDYARNKDILELKRHGAKKEGKVFMVGSKSNKQGQEDSSSGDTPYRKNGGGGEPRPLLTLEQKAKLPCPRWSMYNKCRWGKDCHYSHAGPGGTPADAINLAKKGIAQEASQPGRHVHFATEAKGAGSCYYCQSPNHQAQTCPAAQDVDHTYMAAVAAQEPAVPRTSHSQKSFPFLVGMLFLLFSAAAAVFTAPARAAVSLFSPLWNMMNSNLDADHVYPRRRGWNFPWRAMSITLMAILVYQATATDPIEQDYILNHCYVSSDANALSSDFEWCVDSGTSRFITNDPSDFVPGTVVHEPTELSVAGGSATSPCKGTVFVRSPDTNITVTCKDVLYLPSCGKKLMPVAQFVKKGCTFQIHDFDKVDLKDKKGVTVFKGKEFRGLYYYRAVTLKGNLPTTEPLDTVPDSPTESDGASFFGLPVGRVTSSGATFAKQLMETHLTLGHMNFATLRKMFGLKAGDNPNCPACDTASLKKEPLHENRPRATQMNYRIHIDIAFTNGGPAFQVTVDDYSRVSHVDILKSKDEAFEKYVELKRFLENRHPLCKVAYVRSDNDMVYTSKVFVQHCLEEGVEHEFSPHHRQDKNGVVERIIGIIGVCFRAMMFHGGAPDSDIPDALLHANVVHNNSPTKANNGWTPKEKELGMRLPVNRRLLKGPLFCLVYAAIYKEQREKHGAQGVACVYLGYDDHNDQFKVKEWSSGRIYYTGDGRFHPDVFPYRASPQYSQRWMNELDALTPGVPVSAPDLAPNPMPTGPRRSIRMHDFQFSNGQNIADIPDVDVPPQAHFVHTFGPDPENWSEAMASRFANDWILASLLEKRSFEMHKVYELVPRSSVGKKRIYKPRPVFKIKILPPDAHNPFPALEKFKYRQTIAAYTKSMVMGVDFEEKRASTVRWEATLIIMGIANHFQLSLTLIDIKTFFLYGDLTDEVYMEQPPEWEDSAYPASEFVCRLLKSMYGLPQAPHRAQLKLKEVLLEAGFRQTAADDCIYVWGNPGDDSFAVVGTHVDDILCAGTPSGRALAVKALAKTFECTVKDDPPLITAVQVVRDKNSQWLKLHQAAYVDVILTEFNMTDCNTVSTPMDPGTCKALMELPLASEDSIDKKVATKYRKLVGMLIWLHKTRPDLLFTINLLARFLKLPTEEHFQLAKSRVLRYLQGTRYLGIVFSGPGSVWTLSAQCDADLAGDLRTSRSTNGYFAKVGEFGAISFHSSLERKISTSTQQAETYALSWGLRDVMWIRTLMTEIGLDMNYPVDIDTDNRGVFLQSSKQVNHATAKHFRINQAFIRQAGEDAVCRVNKVNTIDNHSDIFTKALHTDLFVRHRSAIMGPQKPPRSA